MALAIWIAKRHIRLPTISLAELISAAYYGLCRAALYWDGQGKFETYATRGIKLAIQDDVELLSRCAYLPRRTRNIVSRCVQEFGPYRFPSREELSRMTGYRRGISENRYRQLYMAWLLYLRPKADRLEWETIAVPAEHGRVKER